VHWQSPTHIIGSHMPLAIIQNATETFLNNALLVLICGLRPDARVEPEVAGGGDGDRVTVGGARRATCISHSVCPPNSIAQRTNDAAYRITIDNFFELE
jgi:hypothetical protein